MDISYEFVNYGEVFSPRPGVLVLDVGMTTVPGVIDHHHPQAEPECTASLIAKYPHLVLDHLRGLSEKTPAQESPKLRIITHRLPDFDALSSIFLVYQLLALGHVNRTMETIAAYAKMVDSASLPRNIDLAATPYSILRALFSSIKKEEAEANQERIREGLKLMRFLYDRAEEGYDIRENRRIFAAVDRYERAMRKIEDDYFHYLGDVRKGLKVELRLPRTDSPEKERVEGLIVRNPSSFLLKEWARRDTDNVLLGQGFSFLMTNFGDRRFILGVDPARGVHLKGLGTLLNEKEEVKRMALGQPLTFRWYEGDCPFFNYRIIDSPQDGTVLNHDEVVNLVLSFSEGAKL